MLSQFHIYALVYCIGLYLSGLLHSVMGILSRVKQITSPGWMHETSAWGWCTGKTQRDGWRGRWEGRLGWEIYAHPWLIHVSVWQKPLQYCN